MGPRRNELLRLGELVGQHLRGPYADQVRGKLAEWCDPRAKALRQRRRAVRRTRLWTAAGVTTGGGAVVLETASTDFGAGVTGLVVAAGVAGVMTVVTGVRAWRLHRVPLPAAAHVPAALPARGSAAREPMARLAQAEDTLRELLAQLGRGALVPSDSIEHSRRTGADAAGALREVAAQLGAVERARDHAPAADRGHLADGVRRLRGQLDEGVEGYCGLVAAAGRVLAASSPAGPRHDLVDATDHLAGLALALRDLR
ncbi:phage shock envelope stress response protein PspM [Actinokineospora sp.]|uniref:phage shock envelope stress response protein PspM n=1 Tax=Actinokineospora sp. TaxID=1872133 RepID=UPI0040382E3C